MKSMVFVKIVLACLGAAGAAGCGGGGGKSPSPSPSPSPTPSHWRAAVGAGGTLAQTFDDATWESRVVDFGRPAADLFAVTCAGNLIGWAAGAGGTIVHTEDGGRTWRAQESHVGATLRAIRFADASLGVSAGDDGALVVTHDGGTTWTKIASAPVSFRGAATAGDVGLVVAVGERGTVARSIDGGGTWSTTTIRGAADLRGAAADVAGHVVLAVDSAGAVWSSTDRAATFVREASAPAALEAVAIGDDGARALAVGAHGVAVERDALGAWRAVATGLDVDLHAALVTDGDGGDGGDAEYVAGDRGTLASRRSDAGPWQSVALTTKATLYALDDL